MSLESLDPVIDATRFKDPQLCTSPTSGNPDKEEIMSKVGGIMTDGVQGHKLKIFRDS